MSNKVQVKTDNLKRKLGNIKASFVEQSPKILGNALVRGGEKAAKLTPPPDPFKGKQSWSIPQKYYKRKIWYIPDFLKSRGLTTVKKEAAEQLRKGKRFMVIRMVNNKVKKVWYAKSKKALSPKKRILFRGLWKAMYVLGLMRQGFQSFHLQQLFAKSPSLNNVNLSALFVKKGKDTVQMSAVNRAVPEKYFNIGKVKTKFKKGVEEQMLRGCKQSVNKWKGSLKK